jgi:hypothetical protein
MKKVRTTDFCNCQPLEKRNPPATLLLFSGSFVPQKPRGSDTFSAGAGAAAGVLSFSLSRSLSLSNRRLGIVLQSMQVARL